MTINSSLKNLLLIRVYTTKQSIYEWIENNTDEQDRLINLVMKW
nr:DUF1108 family protein [Staphylococcus aureus]